MKRVFILGDLTEITPDLQVLQMPARQLIGGDRPCAFENASSDSKVPSQFAVMPDFQNSTIGKSPETTTGGRGYTIGRPHLTSGDCFRTFGTRDKNAAGWFVAGLKREEITRASLIVHPETGALNGTAMSVARGRIKGWHR